MEMEHMIGYLISCHGDERPSNPLKPRSRTNLLILMIFLVSVSSLFFSLLFSHGQHGLLFNFDVQFIIRQFASPVIVEAAAI